MRSHTFHARRPPGRRLRAAVLAVTTLALVVGTPRGLLAQDDPDPAASTSELSDEGSRWASYGMGIGFGAAGFVLGAIIGAQFEDSCQELECFDEAFWMGSAVGALGVGGGVHLGNGARGNVWLTLLTSVGTGMAGAAAALAIDSDPGSVVIGVSTVFLQLIVTTEVERATGRSRARSRRASEGSGASRGTDDSGIRVSFGVVPTVSRGKPGMTLAGRLNF